MLNMNSDKAERQPGTTIVSGYRLLFVRLGVAVTILFISFRKNRNPLKAISLLHALIKERVKLHENAGEIKVVKAGLRYYWSVNIPGWPSENFDHFISNEFNRIYSPENSNLQTIIFAITNLCPLSCIHCYESDNISDKNRLTIHDLRLVMDKIREKRIKHIQFSGGEPLNRFDDMIELMLHSGRKNEYWINTSGFGLTAEKARIMKENGMTGAIISLDDWDETNHNNFRQNNRSFYWVMEAVKNCREAGIIVCLSVCPVRDFVTEYNLGRFHQLAKDIGAAFVRIMEPRNAGRFLGKDILLREPEIDIIHRFVLSRNHDRAYRKYPIIQFPGYYQRKSGCIGAGNRYIYIDTNGDFHVCPFCRKSLGNAVTASITEGIERARASGCHKFKQRALF
jgi:MoaA/NifB/PqqE/SkfB family radical SAM enzyme